MPRELRRSRCPQPDRGPRRSSQGRPAALLRSEARRGFRAPTRHRHNAARTSDNSPGIAMVPQGPDLARRNARPHPTHTCGSGNACTLLASARAHILASETTGVCSTGPAGPADTAACQPTQRPVSRHSGLSADTAACQPTEPSIWSSMSRLHSTAYSIGKVRVIGSMKPFTTMLIAWLSESPRLIR